MRNITIALPSLGFVIATRAMLAAGIGMLVGGRLSAARRRNVGRALVAIGAATTVPALMLARRGLARAAMSPSGSPVHRDHQLVGVTRFARKGDEPL